MPVATDVTERLHKLSKKFQAERCRRLLPPPPRRGPSDVSSAGQKERIVSLRQDGQPDRAWQAFYAALHGAYNLHNVN